MTRTRYVELGMHGMRAVNHPHNQIERGKIKYICRK